MAIMTCEKEFTNAYIEAALSASYDDQDVPFDDEKYEKKLRKATRAELEAHCKRFLEKLESEPFTDDERNEVLFDAETAGYHFWMTRNGHGVGFWDGDWPAELGQKLTTLSKSFGECTLYIGDDGRIYLFQG